MQNSGKYSASTPFSSDPACSHMCQYSSQAGLNEPCALSKYLYHEGFGTDLISTRMLTNSGTPRIYVVYKNEAAFTLLEVMIAVSIIAIGLVALFGSQSRSLSLATEAHFNNVAPMLTSLKLAELQSRIIPLESNEGDFDDDFSGYTWKIEVSDASLGSFETLENIQDTLQQVTLTVSWSETTYTYSITYYEFRL